MNPRDSAEQMSMVHIKLKPKRFYFMNAMPLMVGGGTGFRKALGNQAKKQGVYVIFSRTGKAIYVGKTSGDKMDFGIRLYRHARKAAAGKNRKVYNRLKETEDKARVSMIDTEVIRKHFVTRNLKLGKRVLIGLMELALIQYLEPELQREEWLSPQHKR